MIQRIQKYCSDITGEHFENINDHTKFIKNGGCDIIIDTLAGSVASVKDNY